MEGMIQVGEFKSDGKDVWGPATYMEVRGSEKLRRIESGTDEGFNAMCAAGQGISTVNLVLVCLQTDYAGWLGQQDLELMKG